MKSRFAIVVLLLLPGGVMAQGRNTPSAGPPLAWDVNLGVGVALRPTFEGSDRYLVRPIPIVGVTWRDTISFGEGGLSAYWHHGNFRIGSGLTFDPGRKDHSTGSIFGGGDDRLAGLGTIDTSLGFRGFASYRLGPVNFDVAATKFTGNANDGLLVNFGAGTALSLTRKLFLIPHVRATWANDSYTQTYFGVTVAQAAASRFSRFNAGAGFKDVRGGVNLIWRFNKHWYAGVDASVTQLLGDAAASPISIADRSETITTLIGYRF
jgi:MipA family protein